MPTPSSHDYTPQRKVSLPPLSILGATPTAQPALPTTAPHAVMPAVIMLGLDDQGRPHASWFEEEQTDAAAVAADLMGMALIDVSVGEEVAAVASCLPKGKLFDSGKAFVPFVKRSTYDQLAAHLDEEYAASAAARVEAAKAAAAENYAKASKGEAPPRQPEDWSKLMVGDLVLAADDPADGWFDAEVLELLADDRLRLRWRDYQDLTDFTRRIVEIALLHPKFPAR